MNLPRHPLTDDRYRTSFSVSDTPVMEAGPRLHRYVLGKDGMALMTHRGNGQDFFATYRSEGHAVSGLVRARRDVPGCELVDRERPTHRTRANRQAFITRLRRRFRRWLG